MKILFDHNVDRRFRRHLPGYFIQTTREMNWDRLSNGVLLKAAADAGFDAFISIDQNIEYEQNLKTLPISVVVIDSASNALPSLIPFAPHVLRFLTTPLKHALYVLKNDGTVVQVDTPRP